VRSGPVLAAPSAELAPAWSCAARPAGPPLGLLSLVTIW